MSKTERDVWIEAIRMDAQAIRSAVNTIYGAMAEIVQALKDLDEHTKQLGSS